MKRSALLPVFLIVFVGVLGFTIVFPLLPFFAERFGATPLVATLLASSYALCSLISTPIIGRLSDQFGRRRLLLVSQAGTCGGLIMIGLSRHLWMVFLGRIIDGLTAGNLALAQAYISDHTEPQHRTRAFGVIGMAFGLGFFIGPAISGWLGDYGLHVPFMAAAGLSAAAMVLTRVLLEPDGAGPAVRRKPRAGLFDIAIYTEYLGRRGVGAVYLLSFLFAFTFSSYMSGFALFAERRFTTADGHAWSSHEVGFLFAYAGCVGIVLQGGLLGRLVKRFGEARLATAGLVAAMTGYLTLGLAQTLFALVAVATLVAFSNGVLRPVITSEITRRFERHEQGIALGIANSINSLAMMLAPPTGGSLLERGWLVGWTLVPATTATLGLGIALWRRAIQAESAGKTPTRAPGHESS
ncbi:MAG TPA: MFS transporter [Kofleriaceae bacterium]|nr:MFS transporter [Kofleriaceae bacterium]